MKCVVLAPSVYSERSLLTQLELIRRGNMVIGCLCVSSTDIVTLVRKSTQMGLGRFAGYALRRLGVMRRGNDSNKTNSRFDNPYLEKRLSGMPGKDKPFDLVAACRRDAIPLMSVSDINGKRALSFLRNLDPDLLVYTGGGIVRDRLLEIPKVGVLNAHAGLLPAYRGMNVMEWAVLNGDTVGLTVHLFDDGVDTGNILFTREIPVTDADASLDLFRHRIVDMTVDGLADGVDLLAGGDAKLREQPQVGKQYFVMHEALVAIAEGRLQRCCTKKNRP